MTTHEPFVPLQPVTRVPAPRHAADQPFSGSTTTTAPPALPEHIREKITRYQALRHDPLAPTDNTRRGRTDGSAGFDRGTVYMALGLLIVGICAIKIITLEDMHRAWFWGIYSIVVTGYILSRFMLAWSYKPRYAPGAETYLPTVAIVVPAYNEGSAIADTVRACLAVDYPQERIQVIAVDDKSTDDTLTRLREVEAAYPQLTVVAAPVNQGKRHALARGMQAAGDAEVLIFIDSDSIVEPHAVRRLVKHFADPDVGAAAGHTDVWNRNQNLLTRMQAVRYYVAFRVNKSAEALFNTVTCCSGCFSGYRTEALRPILQPWLNQRFLGQPSTYGDDRSLTNFLLKDGWKVQYAPDAQAYTNVPDQLRVFLRQQLRWKKSWVRESLRASAFMWRKNPIMSISFYVAIVLPLMAPHVIFRAFVTQPHFNGALPYWYLAGMVAMALLYGLYYRLHNHERLWLHGVFFAFFYTTILIWQLPYAFATIRDSKWGTR